MRARRGWVALAALLAAAAGTAARGDELVTRDGQVIETRGPWEVRGKLVVFTLADGTLASLRLTEADLEASEQRAKQAQLRAQQERQRPAQEPAEPRQAVMVLTDRDVSHAPDLGEESELEGVDDGALAAGTAEGAGDAKAGADSPVASTGRGVQVVQWGQEAEGEGGVAVRGVIQNLGSSFATKLSVNALFYDESGALLAAREVQFEDGPLGPGARRNFSVSLPHSLIYDEIKFQVVGSGFRSVGQSVRAGRPDDSPEEPEE